MEQVKFFCNFEPIILVASKSKNYWLIWSGLSDENCKNLNNEKLFLKNCATFKANLKNMFVCFYQLSE